LRAQRHFFGQGGTRCHPVSDHEEPELVDHLAVQPAPKFRRSVSFHYPST
jgi:hypothetical protein